ncbi:MAG: galactose-1-phosphate uridylyltransferase [Christensenellaceae bacterium]|jgi:UDPglucose--hexose-1-phosphate uridylyltransferase|nr:galactose-1-phosphate uridylyltransferase [Christensenellaceae bacterium]
MAKLEVVISDEIATLCSWAEHNLHLSFIDAIFAQNQLLDLFLQSTPGIARPVENLSLQKDILDPMLAYARKHKLSTKEDTILFETRVMGLVTPAQSTVLATFDAKAATDGIEEAEDYLNSLAVNSNYIRRVDIAKNVKWQVLNARGDLVITINLSKPEKTNKQVLQEFTKTEVNYPRCALCLENLGFAGDQMRAARQTLRVIPISLCGEEWFFQFSPYVYFDHHSIVFSKEHVPMKITPDTFVRQFDFLELFPNYFIGSNADLPIVGGSILSHDHFQCGKKVLPMFSRAARGAYRHQDFNDVAVYVLDWYNSVVVLKSKNRQSIEKLAAIILSEWRNYSDPQSNILAWTDGKPHNTVTPIATLDDNGIYSLYMILRNNRTDEKHPYGIFHPTEDMHNIKMEGIGLI